MVNKKIHNYKFYLLTELHYSEVKKYNYRKDSLIKYKKPSWFKKILWVLFFKPLKFSYLQWILYVFSNFQYEISYKNTKLQLYKLKK